MKIWNVEKQAYEPYTVPEDWFCPLYCNTMEEPINCASCGTLIEYGDAYTSAFIHTQHGLGYSVCFDCRAKERDKELKYKKG